MQNPCTLTSTGYVWNWERISPKNLAVISQVANNLMNTGLLFATHLLVSSVNTFNLTLHLFALNMI